MQCKSKLFVGTAATAMALAALCGRAEVAVDGLHPYGADVNNSFWCTTGRVNFAQHVGRAQVSGSIVSFRGTHTASANAISFNSNKAGLVIIFK